MSVSVFIILTVIGLAGGFFSGTFGLGGGLILIPSLVFLAGLSQKTAQGTSIAIMLMPLGIFAFMNFYKSGYVNIRYAIIIALTFMIGSYFGSWISIKMPEHILSKIFGWILLVISIKYIFNK